MHMYMCHLTWISKSLNRVIVRLVVRNFQRVVRHRESRNSPSEVPLWQGVSGADSGGGAPGARPPPKKKKEKRERERERRRRGGKEETIRSIRGKTSAEAFVISF